MRLVRLEAELEGHAAQDQPAKHQDQRQVQRAEHDRIGQRERGKQRRAAQDQPGFVAVPDRRDGVHHRIAIVPS